MRSITKGPEPGELADARRDAARRHRKIKGSDWDLPGNITATIRAALHTEQFGLCAYCGNRLKRSADGYVPAANRGRPQSGGMTVEHWIPRSGFDDDPPDAKEEAGTLALTWTNLLGVCVGVSLIDGGKEGHCDEVRRNRKLYLHPAREKNLCLRFKVTRRGELVPRDDDDHEALQDIETLGLNTARLRENRREILRRLQNALQRDGSDANLRSLWAKAVQPVGGLLPVLAADQARYLARKLRARGLPVDFGEHPA